MFHSGRDGFLLVPEFPVAMLHRFTETTGHRADQLLVMSLEYGEEFRSVWRRGRPQGAVLSVITDLAGVAYFDEPHRCLNVWPSSNMSRCLACRIGTISLCLIVWHQTHAGVSLSDAPAPLSVFSGPDQDTFRWDRAISDPLHAEKSNFLHPVLYFYGHPPTGTYCKHSQSNHLRVYREPL